MNFVFISPNYPESYWMFCRGLKKYGATVLAIVDTPYDSLKPELKRYVDECYVVKSFSDYDAMLKAVAYFTFKYGKIDWIESNNEAWLTLDARLRDDFNVKSGFSLAQIEEFQSKSAMKKYYEAAGVPVAGYCLPETAEEAVAFAHTVGYPVVLKPDHGVGASFTYKVWNDEEMRRYFGQTEGRQMIVEQFVTGEIVTLDGICDANGDIRFLASLKYVGNCMDSVQLQDSIGCYYDFNIPEAWKKTARKVIQSFGLKNRFFHGEYFVLDKDVENLGPKGTLVGLEVNFRPPGGFAPDLMNYSNDMDVYDMWAHVLLKQEGHEDSSMKYSAGYAGRRNSISYKYTTQEVESMFRTELLNTEYMAPAFAHAMGDVAIKARFTSDQRRQDFFNTALMRKED